MRHWQFPAMKHRHGTSVLSCWKIIKVQPSLSCLRTRTMFTKQQRLVASHWNLPINICKIHGIKTDLSHFRGHYEVKIQFKYFMLIAYHSDCRGTGYGMFGTDGDSVRSC